jgi:hypothetical protein
MIRGRLYGLALAVPACAAIGGEAYQHVYVGPVMLYDPMIGYGCGAAVGVFPGLLGRRVVIRGHGLGAVRGSLTGVFLVLAAATVIELIRMPYRSGWPMGRYRDLNALPALMLLFGIPPAITLGGLVGWHRHYDPRPDEDEDEPPGKDGG